MAENKIVVCFNALERRFFQVSALHLVDDPYRRNYYRLSLRLSFYDGDVNVNHIDNMRHLCFRKITNLMSSQNMWQDHHSFYVIEYEIRLIARRRGNRLIQHNDNEKDDESSYANSVSSIDSHESSFEAEEGNTSGDSAYGSPTDESGSDNHSDGSEDETIENLDGSDTLITIDD